MTSMNRPRARLPFRGPASSSDFRGLQATSVFGIRDPPERSHKPRPHRRTAPRRCGGRFEFFTRWRRQVKKARKSLLVESFSLGAATACERRSANASGKCPLRAAAERLELLAVLAVPKLLPAISAMER